MNLAVSLRDLKIGGRSVLPAGEGTTVSPQAHSGRPPEVVYSRGPVTERYLLLADAVEQIFTLGSDLEALRVEGDLTVDLGLGTSLTPVLKRSEGGGPVREWVEFQGPEGRPLLTIGAALAVEAEGRTRTLRYELVEGGLVMRLDASFLKEARFPLTIDPLIGSFLSFSSTYRDRVAGVAYSPAADVFLAVTEYGWNPDQGDILCTAVDASGNYWSAFVTNQYTDDSRAPRVARSSGNQFLVVWQERSGATGWSIRGRFVTIAGLTPTLSAPTFTIATGNDDINPDVGFSAGAGVYTVCWERVVSASNHDIQAVTVTTAGVVGTPFALDTASSFEETPSITSAMPGILGVAWIRRSAPGAQGDVQACSVDASAGSATAPVAISAVPSDEETPRLGGDFTGSGTTYLAWVRRAAGGDGDIWGQRITFGAGGPAAGSAFSVEAGGANSFHPSCDAGTRSGIQRVAFAWSRNPTVPPTQLGSDLYGAVYDASVDPPTLVEALSVDTSTSGSTHSAVAVNPSLMNALVVWNEESSPGSIQFYGRRVALTAVPAIGVNASSYSFTTSAAGGSSAYGNLTVSNLSGGTLIYTATEPASWLTLSSGGASLAPGASYSATLTANPAGLPGGVYSTTITVSDPAALNSPVAIPVTFTVVSLAWNGPAPSGTFTSGQPLPVSWTLAAGGATATHHDVHFDTSSSPYTPALPSQPGGSGTYSGSVEAPIVATPSTCYLRPHALVNGVDAYGPVASVTVNPATTPLVGLNSMGLNFVAKRGGPNPGSQPVTVSNPGTGTLSWSAASNAAWLSIGSSSGSLVAGGSQAVAVWQNVAGLAAGTYTGTITFTAAGALNSGKTLSVTLTVVDLAWVTPPASDYTSGQTVPLSWSVSAAGLTNFFTMFYYGTNLPLSGGSGFQAAPASGTYSGTFVAPEVTAPTTYFFAPHASFSTPYANATGPVVTVIIHPRPSLSVSTSLLTFGAPVGGPDPASQNLTITNLGEGTLNWSSTSNASWLSLNPALGSRPPGTSQAAAVSVNVTGLAAGSYAGTLTLVDAASIGPPRTVQVELVVASVSWVTPPGGSYTSGQTIPVSWSLSAGTMASTHNKVHYDTANPPWSGSGSANQPGPSGTYSESLTAPSVAAPTIYYFGVHADVNGAGVRSPVVAVTINPPTLPVIGLSSRSLSFTANQGGPNPAAQTVTVTSAGVGTLNWSASDGSSWLSESPASGSLAAGASQSMTVSVDVTGLAANTYTGTVTVAAGGASNSPQTIAVSLVVLPAPVASLGPAALQFVAAQGGASPTGQGLVLTQTGLSPLAWTATDNASWLSVSPTSGIVNPPYGSSLFVSVDITGLAAGSYSGTVTVTVPGAANSPRTVAVTLTVVQVSWVTPPAASYASNQTIAVTWNVSIGTAAVDTNHVLYTPATSPYYGLSTPNQPGSSGTYSASFAAPTVAVPTTYLFRATIWLQGASFISPMLSVVIQPAAAPAISLNSPTLTFIADEGAPSPFPSYASLTNTGVGTMSWSLSSSQAWLSATPGSGTLAPGPSQSLSVSVNTTGMTVGTYTGSISVTAPGAANTPQSIAVTLRVVKTAWVTPPAGPYTSGQVIPLSWSVDAQSLPVTGSEVHWATSNPPWSGPGSGGQSGGSGTYSVNVLAPMVTVPTTYYFGAHASAQYTNTGSPIIAVTVNPSAAPVIGLSATSLAFAAPRGGPNPSYQTVTLTNSGSVPLAMSVSDNAAWLTVGPGPLTLPAGASQALTVSADVTGLAAGTYAGTITVSDPGASNSPQSISVSLTVVGLNWVSTPPLDVSSGQTVPFAWSVVSGSFSASQNYIRYGTANPPWGYTTPDQPGPAGTYSASIVAPTVYSPTIYYFQPNAYVNSYSYTGPVAAVVVHPLPASITLGTSSLSFVALRGGANPPPQTFSWSNSGGSTLDWSVTDDAAWLSVSPASGTLASGYASLTASVDTTGLAPGSYSTVVAIRAPDATNSPRTMTVSLVVVAIGWVTPPGASYAGGQTIPFSWSFDAGSVGATGNAVGYSPLNPPLFGPFASSQPGSSGTYSGSAIAPVVAAPTPYYFAPYVVVNGIGLWGPVAPVTINPPTTPLIGLGATSLTFTAMQGGPNPASQAVTVTNVGVGTLPWTAADGVAWLGQSPGSGSLGPGASQPVDVSVDVTGLAAGSYAATILISGGSALNSPQSILVTLTVTPATPVLSLNPGNLAFTGAETGADPAAQAVTLTNAGGGTLGWTATKTGSWLTVGPLSGSRPAGTSESLTVSVSLAGITAGTYTGTITVTAAGASNSPQTLFVTLTVRPPVPAFGLSPSDFAFTAVAGGANPASQILTVTNAGVGTLNWAANDDGAWLTIGTGAGSLGGGASQPVTISADITGLAAGWYSATITLTDPGALSSPVTVPVSLRVDPPAPRIDIFGSPPGFSAPPGGPNPGAQISLMYNGGSGTLNWTATPSAPWIGVAPASGTLAQGPYQNLAITVNVTGLAAGLYSGTVTVSDPAASNNPRIIPVTLVVGTIAWVSPPSGTFSGGQTIPFSWNLSVGGATASTNHVVVNGSTSVANQPGGSGTYSGSTIAPSLPAPTPYTFYAQAIVGGVWISTPMAEVTILPPTSPVISLGNSSLSFLGESGSPGLSSQAVLLTNGGTGTLNWTATDNAAWLNLSPSSGSLAAGRSENVTAWVDTTGLGAGTYTATLTVSDPAAPNSPRTVAVTLTIPTLSWVSAPPVSVSSGQSIPFTWSASAGSLPISATYVHWDTYNPPTYGYFTPAQSGPPGNFSASVVAPAVAGSTLYFFRPYVNVGIGTVRGPVVTVLVNPLPAPRIGLNQTTLNFVGQQGGPSPYGQSVQVSNSGGGALNWSATDPVGWVSESPPSGTNLSNSYTSVTVTIDTTGLATGTYSTTITISDPAASNNPQTVTVNLTVMAVAWVTPPSASYTSGQSIPFTWNLATGGASATHNDVHYATFTPPSSSGLSSGNQPGPPGNYSSSVTAPPVIVPTTYYFQAHADVGGFVAASPPVSVTINPGAPAIGLNFTSLNLYGILGGGNPAPTTYISISNPGSAILNWTATETAPWLTVSPSSGSLTAGGSHPLVLSADITGLAAGSYQAVITVTDPAASNSPRRISVELKVLSVTWVTPPSASYNGGETIAFTWNVAGGSTTYTYGVYSSTTPPIYGSTPAQSGPPGNYSASIVAPQVDAPATLSFTPTAYIPVGPGLTAQANGPLVSVTLNPGPRLFRTPSAMTFTGVQGGTDPAAQTLTITNSGGAVLTWGAVDTAPWLTLGLTGGSLSSAASQPVLVSAATAGLAPGTYSAVITLSGAASDSPQTVAVTLTVTPDVTPPSVTRVTSTTGNGTYGLGANINLTVDFSEPVTLAGGNLRVTLDTGAVVAIPPFGPALSAAGTYTVASGQNSPDLNATSPLALEGGATLRDIGANNAALSIPGGQNIANLKAIVVDTAAPGIANVTSATANGTYVAGQSIGVTVNFTEPVTLAAGNLLVTLDTGATVTIAPFGPATTASGTYVVASGHLSADLTAVSPLALQGGATLRDGVGNNAALAIPGGQNIADLKQIAVDAVVPAVATVTSGTANGGYGAGAAINITVTFTEPVTLAGGTLRVTLDTGTVVAIAPFAASTSAVGTYTVTSGQNTADLAATSPLTLQAGATLRDAAGNNSVLTVPSGQNLADLKQIVVDTSAPSITITAPTNLSTYTIAAPFVSLGGTALDNLGIAGVTWANAATTGNGAAVGTGSWTAGSIPLNGGSNIITVTVTDTAGNSATDMIDVTSTPDVSPPTGTVSAPATAVSSPVLVTGTASDNVGVTRVTWTNTTGGQSGIASGTGSWSANVPLLPGANEIVVVFWDAAGNSTIQTVTVTYTPADATPPGIAIVNPSSSGSATVAATPVTVDGSASDNVGVAAVSWVNATTGVSGPAGGPTAWSAPVPLTSGDNVVVVTAWDAAGNSSSATITITYAAPADGVAPAIAITSPTGGATWGASSTPLALAGTASDAVGVSRVTWTNAGTGGAGTASGTLSWAASVPLAPGTNFITVTAQDPAGNTSAAVLDVTFVPPAGDTVPPLLFITAPTSAAAFSVTSTPVLLGGWAADDVGLNEVVWSNPAAGRTGSATGLGSWSATVPLVLGTNVITITATDLSGNAVAAMVSVDYSIPAGGGGGGGGGGCGSSGLDLLAPVGLLWLLRVILSSGRRSSRGGSSGPGSPPSPSRS